MKSQQTDREILICYDGSSEAERAIEAAAELFPGRRAVVLEVGPTMTFAEAYAATSSLVPGGAFDELNTADARARAETGAEQARRVGLHAVPRAEIASTTWREIVDVAEEIDAAVIVIGSRGLDGIRELARGSVSHDVATHAGRPVLVVPAPGHGATQV
jgi:nucleotide-binding universal stress UspA family protein